MRRITQLKIRSRSKKKRKDKKVSSIHIKKLPRNSGQFNRLNFKNYLRLTGALKSGLTLTASVLLAVANEAEYVNTASATF